ncbi:MAG: hypothetical protein A2293_06850 [Elusimicrobia bacterium RIFOXYB2_FULL_49_7]|nr:MAG: hypothetical protein A2293_06850 [Elusimicrobia bacterium RIFOXYB2_FULL_49_7]
MNIAGVNVNVNDTFWITINVIVKLTIGIGGNVAFARLTGVEYFGKYQYALSLSSFAALFILPGLQNALVNSAVRGSEGDFGLAFRKRSKLLPWYILFFVGAGIITYVKTHTIEIPVAFVLIGILSALIALYSLYFSYFMGKRYYRELFFWESALAAAPLTAVVALLVGNRVLSLAYIPVYLLVLVPLAWQLIVSMGVCYRVRKYIKSQVVNEGFLTYAKHFSYMTIIGGIQGNLDSFIVGTFISYNSLAYYSIAKRFFEATKSLWGMSQVYLQPRLVGKKIGKAVIHFKEFLRVYYVLTPLLIVAWFLLPSVINLFYGAEFKPSSVYAQMFLLGIFFSVPSYYLESYFRAKEYFKDMYYSRVINFFSLGLLMVFIYFFKVHGVVLNRVITILAVSIVMALLFMKRYKENDDHIILPMASGQA